MSAEEQYEYAGVPDYRKVKVIHTAEMIAAGLPPPEKWKGLELARTVGSKGFTFDTLVEDAKKMIGFEKWEGEPPTTKLGEVFDAYTLREYVLAHGDDNPLYTDPKYGKTTRYGCMLMYPTMLMSVASAMHHNVQEWGPYPISSLQAGYSWEYYDVIRVNTRFRASVKMKDVYEKRGRTGRLCFFITDLSYWNQRDDLVATGGGIYIDVGKSGAAAKLAEETSRKGEGMSKTPLYERPTYHYSEEEVQKIIAAIEGEERRGATPRYWEDVNIGDTLGPVVKGPLTFMDFQSASSGPMGASFVPVMYARPTINPLTGWAEPTVMHHFDFNLCRFRGLPGPFDIGGQRVTMTAHLLCNWMGDDGFLRRVSTQIRKPGYYGDTQWFSGEIVNKYKDTVADIEYGAVDIVISVINQVQENTLPGKATIYLPSREFGEVVLPIPLPTEEDWKWVTQRDVNDFVREIESGETIFPPLTARYVREDQR